MRARQVQLPAGRPPRGGVGGGRGAAVAQPRGARCPRFDLRVEDGEPELLRLDRLARLPLRLVLLVERLELGAPRVVEPGALVRAEERPLAVRLDALHEEVGHPQRVEEVARARLLLAVVLAQVEEVEDVGVPRLDVHGERALPLAAALVDEARRVVEDAQHRHEPVRRAVGAGDVGARRADVRDREADAAARL